MTVIIASVTKQFHNLCVKYISIIYPSILVWYRSSHHDHLLKCFHDNENNDVIIDHYSFQIVQLKSKHSF